MESIRIDKNSLHDNIFMGMVLFYGSGNSLESKGAGGEDMKKKLAVIVVVLVLIILSVLGFRYFNSP
ncbi:MAG: hypothetical protein WA125_10670, partial [Desulfosporosinus sp.]